MPYKVERVYIQIMTMVKSNQSIFTKTKSKPKRLTKNQETHHFFWKKKVTSHFQFLNLSISRFIAIPISEHFYILKNIYIYQHSRTIMKLVLASSTFIALFLGLSNAHQVQKNQENTILSTQKVSLLESAMVEI